MYPVNGTIEEKMHFFEVKSVEYSKCWERIKKNMATKADIRKLTKKMDAMIALDKGPKPEIIALAATLKKRGELPEGFEESYLK